MRGVSARSRFEPLGRPPPCCCGKLGHPGSRVTVVVTSVAPPGGTGSSACGRARGGCRGRCRARGRDRCRCRCRGPRRRSSGRRSRPCRSAPRVKTVQDVCQAPSHQPNSVVCRRSNPAIGCEHPWPESRPKIPAPPAGTPFAALSTAEPLTRRDVRLTYVRLEKHAPYEPRAGSASSALGARPLPTSRKALWPVREGV